MKAPKRVSFFVWTAAWGQILTHDNLIKRGFSLVGWCCMCRCSGETVSHLLLHCDVAFGLWSRVFDVFGIQWVLPESVADLLFEWLNSLEKHSSIPGILFFCASCGLCGRTEIVARSKTRRDLRLNRILFFFRTLFNWSRAWGFTHSVSILDFLHSLNTCE